MCSLLQLIFVRVALISVQINSAPILINVGFEMDGSGCSVLNFSDTWLIGFHWHLIQFLSSTYQYEDDWLVIYTKKKSGMRLLSFFFSCRNMFLQIYPSKCEICKVGFIFFWVKVESQTTKLFNIYPEGIFSLMFWICTNCIAFATWLKTDFIASLSI